MRHPNLITIMGMVTLGLMLSISPSHGKNTQSSGETPQKEEAVINCGPLHFAHPPLPVTALVSFPGSGNTWVRHLLQQATGIVTGSVYGEQRFVARFPAGGVTNGSVLVVKTHGSTKSIEHCARLVVLVRDPFRAILAEGNRRHMLSGRGVAPPDYFKSDEWNKTVDALAHTWYRSYKRWLMVPLPALFVVYENIVRNTTGEIQKISQFLNVGVTNEALRCMMKNKEGNNHRKPWHLDFDPFDREQTSRIKDYATEINEDIMKRFNVGIEDTVPTTVFWSNSK